LYVVYHALFFELGSWTAIPFGNVFEEIFFTGALPITGWIVAVNAVWQMEL
jgi:hypothetical protein